MKINVLVFSGLLLLFTACYQRPEPEYEYENFRRVIGPDGGIINFYEYNPEDSVPNVLVSMNFPEGALDSMVVFNMYKFFDQQTENELWTLDMVQSSDFLYFIPFYESYGYNNQTQLETDYHLSINFNEPVTIKYNIKGSKIDEESMFYRIPIPKLNDPDWDDNVWVNWNDQGYPDGYDELDLIYLITGRWTVNDQWGAGNPSLFNWEPFPVDSFDFDLSIDSSVTFQIKNTDYIYVMGIPLTK